MLKVIAGTSALGAAHLSTAAELERVQVDDPYAKSMGFRYDTKLVDQKKYPRHDAATMQCAKCQLFSGKPGEEWGPCSFFGGRLVNQGGWCRNFKARGTAAA
jgi:hypothetical protein